MTDAVIFLLVVVSAFSALAHPWIGILAWTWISIMNPHKLGWRVADMPVAMAVGATTLIGYAITSARRNPFCTAAPVVLLIFMIWMCITLPASFRVEQSMEMWERVMKIDFMILIALALLFTKRHIVALVWVVAGSLAFYGVKGGLFTVLTGGSYRVWGPADSFIGGNNEIALALIMCIPLMRFLQTLLQKKWQRHAMTGAMLLCAAAALGSHSRGALVAIAAMAGMMWWRGKHKLAGGVAMMVIGIGLIAFMPEHWTERMNTIQTYEEDASAMGRINAWWMAWNLASDKFFGGGFAIYNIDTFTRYAPDPEDVHAAHSIYFQVLGEHGFVGLFLFLLVWLLVWRDAGWLRKHAADHPEAEWVGTLGSMCQVCLMGYAVGGAFLSLAYFDLPYNVLIMTAAARRWVSVRGWEHETGNAAKDKRNDPALQESPA